VAALVINILVVINMFGLLDDLDRQDVKDFLNSGVDYAADLGGDLYEGANDIYDSFRRGTAYDDFTSYLGGLFDDDEPRSVMREIEYSQPLAGQGPYPGMAPMQSGGPYPGMITKTTVERVAPDKPKVEIEDISPFMGTDFGYSPKSSSRPKPKMMQVLQEANEMGPRPTVSQSAYGSSAPRGVTAEDQQFMQMLNLSNPEAQMIRRMNQYNAEMASPQPDQRMMDRMQAGVLPSGVSQAPSIDAPMQTQAFPQTQVGVVYRPASGENLVRGVDELTALRMGGRPFEVPPIFTDPRVSQLMADRERGLLL